MAIREDLEAISPAWLRNFVGVRLIYVIGLHVDRLVEKMLEGQIAHLPGQGTPTALPALGQARLIPRGATEIDNSYGDRLRKSWDSWGFSGSNRGVLAVMLGALLDKRPDALAVSIAPDGSDAVWDEYFSGDNFESSLLAGAPSHFHGLDWNWESGVTAWWRIFPVIYSVAPNANWTPDGTWGSGGVWGDGGAWGVNETPQIALTINAALKNWRAGQAWIQWWIVSFDADLFRPANRPDGNWGRWSKIVNGQYVASRNSNARYANGPGVSYP